jgi:hypothetical protein
VADLLFLERLKETTVQDNDLDPTQKVRHEVVDLLANLSPGQRMETLLADAEQVVAYILDGTLPEPRPASASRVLSV